MQAGGQAQVVDSVQKHCLFLLNSGGKVYAFPENRSKTSGKYPCQGTIGPVSFPPSNAEAGVKDIDTGGKALAGFLLSGFLLALLGAILPAWGYHRDPQDFTAVGNYFLSVAVGVVAAAGLARRIMARRGLSFLLVFACSLSCVALAYLALVSPPASSWWRVAGLLVLGIGAGLLNMALFHAISPSYQSDAAGTATMGGAWYGLGCLTATLLVAFTLVMAGTSYVPGLLAVMAVVPQFLPSFTPELLHHPSGKRSAHTAAGAEGFPQPRRRAVRGAVVLSVRQRVVHRRLLPLFLIRRVGLSPKRRSSSWRSIGCFS